MTQESPKSTAQEVSLRLIRERAMAGWRTPAVFTGVAVILAIIMLARAIPIYQVDMSVVPAPSSQAENGMMNTGGVGALLGLTGMQANTSYNRYQKLLVSTAVAERMQRKHDMIHVVFSGLWNSQEKKWVPPQTVRGFLLGWLFKLSSVPIWTQPDVTDLANYLESTLIVVPAAQSDIVRISARHKDPAFARRLILMAHQEANEVLRDQVASRAAQQVAYLQQKLAQTSVQDYRQTLLSLLSAQEKTLMLTKTSAPYAAEILTPPVAQSQPVSPRPVLTIAVAILVGIMAGVATVVLFGPDWWTRTRGFLARLSRRKRPAGG